MVYRLVVHGQALRALKGSVQTKMATSDPSVTTFDSADGTIHEAFRPIRIANGLDQERAEVKEGMRLTFHFLQEMNAACLKNQSSFSVVIIPTKETVFARYLQSDSHLNLKDAVNAVITNEQIATAVLEKFLDDNGIPHVTALPALRERVTEQLYYRGPADMHPGPNGYRVIGETVSRFLRQSDTAGHDRPHPPTAGSQ
jgi:hypothetical protein